MDEEPRPACPQCKSTALVVRIGNADHCNGCGISFNQVRDVIGESARQRKAIGFQGGWRRPPVEKT